MADYGSELAEGKFTSNTDPAYFARYLCKILFGFPKVFAVAVRWYQMLIRIENCTK